MEYFKYVQSVVQHIYLQVLLFVMVYGQNPFANVVKAEECILDFPTSIHVTRRVNCIEALSKYNNFPYFRFAGNCCPQL